MSGMELSTRHEAPVSPLRGRMAKPREGSWHGRTTAMTPTYPPPFRGRENVR